MTDPTPAAGMTRRGAVAGLLGWALLGGRANPDGSSEGVPVERFNLRLPNDRVVWDQPGLWARVAARDEPLAAENPAVSTGPDDPRVRAGLNVHFLRAGPQSVLHGFGGLFFGLVREVCSFDGLSFWPAQAAWLDAVFRRYFPEGAADPGWVSLLGLRRPAQFRAHQDPAIRITQAAQARVAVDRAAAALGAASLRVYDTVIPTRPPHQRRAVRFARPGARESRRDVLFHAYVQRTLVSPRFGLVTPVPYEEVWLSVGRRGADEGRLTRGQIPAVPEAEYGRTNVRLRPNPLLNLVRVNPRAMRYTVLVVEVNPNCGDVLSLRWNRTSLAAGLVNSSPVEHVGLCQALAAA